MNKEKDKNVVLMAELMSAILQSEEWGEILTTNPGVVRANQAYDQALKKLDHCGIPRATRMELEDSVSDLAVITSEVAILYGIHVAEAIRDVSARPSDLSRYFFGDEGEE